MNTVLDQWDRLRNHYLKDRLIHRKKHAQQEHWALFHALQGGDPDRVEDVVRKHNRNALALYAKQLQAVGHLNHMHDREFTRHPHYER